MNRSITCLVIAISLIIPAQAGAQNPDHYAWVKLSGNRVMVNVQLLSLRGNSLLVLRDGAIVEVPVDHILGIKVLTESSMLGGLAIGAGIGAFSGAAVGVALSQGDDNTWNPVSTSMYGCIIGGIIGAVTSTAGHSDRVVNLEHASGDERTLILRDLLETLQRE